MCFTCLLSELCFWIVKTTTPEYAVNILCTQNKLFIGLQKFVWNTSSSNVIGATIADVHTVNVVLIGMLHSCTAAIWKLKFYMYVL